ncbi:NADPH2 dehydrogenase [Spiroplasma chinense]|uniref:NADPH2 dehydrogenase n=1 Tax=Spiroplasma chinense TaxID=216932 RepID=A0A5B9Y363_9MOLU|nr:hypothetical protein [Spiroplasma chinense]QEH61215.1 NADPH2 dehydrogenase [Spiroplasma chinense]
MYKINDKVELIKNLTSRNRIVLPPMDTLMADDGFVSDFHIQHYGARAYGGVGTIIIESTAVSSEGRIRPRDLGLWKDEHIEGFKRIAKLSHDAGAVVGVQLNHAGAKAELEGKIYGATNFYQISLTSDYSLVNEIESERIKQSFVSAAKRAKTAGLDFVEIHAAHGYLLNQFIHPKLNNVIESDNILERAKIILEIVKEIKENISIPVGIRLSLGDDVENTGFQPKEFEPLIKALDPFVEYFHISSGGTIGVKPPSENNNIESRLYKVPYAELVLKWTKKNVITVGEFKTREDVEYALNKNIPFIAIGREQIFNPNLVINSLLKKEELEKGTYHWNNNPWFNPKDYSSN